MQSPFEFMTIGSMPAVRDRCRLVPAFALQPFTGVVRSEKQGVNYHFLYFLQSSSGDLMAASPPAWPPLDRAAGDLEGLLYRTLRDRILLGRMRPGLLFGIARISPDDADAAGERLGRRLDGLGQRGTGIDLRASGDRG